MAANLLKPEAKRQREVAGVKDALIAFGILILFILSVVYIGYRADKSYSEDHPIKNHR